MSNVVYLKPEHAYPDIIARTRKERELGLRIRERVSESWPEIAYSVEVIYHHDGPTQVFVRLKDFHVPIFKMELTESQYDEIHAQWNFNHYLSKEFLDLREEIDLVVSGCFKAKPMVYVEIVGSVIRKNLRN